MIEKSEELILKCKCGGNLFQILKTDDVGEVECIGCGLRRGLDSCR